MCHSYLDSWRESQRTQIEGHVYSFADRFIEQYGGELLPPCCRHLAETSKVLDVACGHGEWVCNLARIYPDSTITGCDRDAEYVACARERARQAGLTNAHFMAGNMYTLPQPEETYDLIHARLLNPAVIPGTWYYLLKELWRHCKHGGNFIWTEARMPTTNKPASTRWCHLFGQALDVPNNAGDVIEHMPIMLKDVGFENIQQSITTIPLQPGSPAYNMLASTLWQASPLLQTFFVQAGVASASHFTHITEEMLMELMDRCFSCRWSLHTVVGQRINT